jgi:SAM-dependent methyltransferase
VSNYSLIKNIDAPSPRYLMRIALLEKLLRRLPETLDSFLEIGPGMGDVSNFLAHSFAGVHGDVVDISEHTVDLVQRRLGDTDGISCFVSDIADIEGSNKYDLVIACEVFEHLKDDDAAFHTVNNLMRPGGHFLFSVPAFMKKWGPADEYGGHERRYEKNPLQEQFQQHGFEIMDFWGYGFPVTNLLNPVSRLYYHAKQREAPLAKQQASIRSGTERGLARKLRFIPMATLMLPFFFIQSLVKNQTVGDGFIVLARKK